MGKHMCVLMAIDVCQRDAARLDLAYLGFDFPLDFFHSNLLADCGYGKLLQAGAKEWRAVCVSTSLPLKKKRRLNN